jgi:hypothetical protein
MPISRLVRFQARIQVEFISFCAKPCVCAPSELPLLCLARCSLLSTEEVDACYVDTLGKAAALLL